jgi:lipopolysaccharide export system protein LptA
MKLKFFNLLLAFIFILPCQKVLAGQGDQPKSWFDWHLDERIRNETRVDLPTSTDYVRFLTQVRASVNLPVGLSLNTGLVNESRVFIIPDKSPYLDEVAFDRLNISIKQKNFSLTLGRQDLTYGSGFLVFEGTPGDGSRSIYFNAAKASINLDEQRKLDIFAIHQPQNDPLVLLNNKHTNITAYSKQKPEVDAFGANFSVVAQPDSIYKGIGKAEIYYLRSNEYKITPEAKLNTLGLRIQTDNFAYEVNNLSLYAESALQWGKYGNDKKGADLSFDWKLGYSAPGIGLKPRLELEGVLLPGYDVVEHRSPTGIVKDELQKGWNPVFSKWPKWGELLPYLLTKEQGYGYYTDLVMVRTEGTVHPFSDKHTLQLAYAYMESASNANAYARDAYVNLESIYPQAQFGKGKVRGRLVSIIYKVPLSNDVAAHVWLERFWPGDFYALGTPASTFFRVETSLRVK